MVTYLDTPGPYYGDDYVESGKSNNLSKKDINEYDQSGKIFVSNAGKLKQTFLSVIDFILLIFLKSDNNKIVLNHNEIKKEINLNERF